jgi:periplasmic copper chaperone A
MRSLFSLALLAAVIAVVPGAFAQTGKTSTISVEQPWARATPAGAQTGAVYMTLANKANTADSLTSASSDVAAKVQIHEMAVVNGIMQMRELANGLAIPAGGSVTLKPGSYHVMLIGLKKALAAGETIPLTLIFAKAGTIAVTVPVKAMSASENSQGTMSGMGMQPKKPGGTSTMEMK